jgi:phosphoribosylpyrophosphate synthetase
MESQTLMIDNAAISKNQRLVRIRQKIKDVFGWECKMTDDMLIKCYSITIDRELVMILK